MNRTKTQELIFRMKNAITRGESCTTKEWAAQVGCTAGHAHNVAADYYLQRAVCRDVREAALSGTVSTVLIKQGSGKLRAARIGSALLRKAGLGGIQLAYSIDPAAHTITLSQKQEGITQ